MAENKTDIVQTEIVYIETYSLNIQNSSANILRTMWVAMGKPMDGTRSCQTVCLPVQERGLRKMLKMTFYRRSFTIFLSKMVNCSRGKNNWYG